MFIREYKKREDSEYIILQSNNEYLSDFKKINIFVGANNSGKSRFLREIFTSSVDDCVYFEEIDRINDKIKVISEQLEKKYGDNFSMNSLKSLTNAPRTGEGYFNSYNNLFDELDKQGSSRINYNGQLIRNLDVAKEIRTKLNDQELTGRIKVGANLRNRCIYIPMLRGLINVDYVESAPSKRDVYKEKTKDMFKWGDAILDNFREIFTGANFYKEIGEKLFGTKNDKVLIEEFEKFLSREFFDNCSVTLRPEYGGEYVKIDIDNLKEFRKIFEVGDGIQSIIIAVFPAFKYQVENLTLFLEEPELTMHPSAQRVLIETFIKNFPNLQVFLTTHSNHFLDLAYEYQDAVSVYSFEPSSEEKEKFYIKNIGYNAKILDLLGVRNSSVFLSNSVIWTEGVTDRILIKKLLSLKKTDFKEDYHYAFAEYGGGNLENFDFVDEENIDKVHVSKIARVNFVIADNDNILDVNNTKYKRLKKIKKFLGTNSFFDKHIEIENLIPFAVWARVIETISLDKPQWGIELKSDYMNYENNFNDELNSKKIGKLLKDYVIRKKRNKKLNYFDKDSVQCLGLPKKEIMHYVTKTIDDLDLKDLKKFPKNTRKLINTLNKFIQNANATVNKSP